VKCKTVKSKTLKRTALKRAMLAAGLLMAATATAWAASEADFKAALAAAEAAEKEAGGLRNQWITTEAALGAARKAAEKGDFHAAVASAKEAEALAKASIFQATSEKERWKDAEIH
jgi:hypothetical protein